MSNSKRTFTFQTRTKAASFGEGLLDIPHPVVLKYKKPSDLVQDFKTKFGVLPIGVVLPVAVPDGVLYPCEGMNLVHSKSTEGTKDYFEKLIEDFVKAGIEKIYLSIDPTLAFVKTDALHVVDIEGSGSQQVCIINKSSQELIGAILGIGIDLTLACLDKLAMQIRKPLELIGVVIDVVDLWPQGAEDDHLQLTCFCPSCIKEIEMEAQNSPRADLLSKFRDFPNPWNLVLKDNKTGIGYIDDLPKGINVKQILGLSRQKQFVSIFGNIDDGKLEEHAQYLLDYINIRHTLTVTALHAIFGIAFEGLKELTPKRILLLEGIHYDWTSGLQLQSIDSPPKKGIGKFDELWFNSNSSEPMISNTPSRAYMWRRSRYLIDAFFQTVATAADPSKRNTTGIARLSENDIRQQLLPKRLGSAMSTDDSNLTSMAALPPMEKSTRIGFVGVAFFDQQGGNDFIKTTYIAPSKQESIRSNDQSKMIEELLRRLSDNN